ncbi:MAG: lipoyl synthase [Deltaproteobacteria bacterium]|nr:lipoyl synthase [Deltaproteobacteria bacterium]
MPRPLKPFKTASVPLGTESTVPASELKKPDWFKVRLSENERYQTIEGLVKEHGLATVCREARCPNIYECWNAGTATFMLMGEECTRACKFCHVKTGNPKLWLDVEEPKKIANSVKTLGLNYVVLTSVNRDDLPDEGAKHFADTVREIKNLNPEILVETLTPDFRRTREAAIQTMIDSGVNVLAHNIETVSRLVPSVRDARCRHEISLNYHRIAKQLKSDMITKSSIMMGLGETNDEVLEAMHELREADVDILTLGQYLQPTKNHHPVFRYVHPDEFKMLEQKGLEMGFKFVASGPMVRSSYRAAEFFIEKMARERVAAN